MLFFTVDYYWIIELRIKIIELHVAHTWHHMQSE